MDCKVLNIPYRETGYFGKLVLDYLAGSEKLKPFYNDFPGKQAILDAISRRQGVATNRSLLTEVLQQQYSNVQPSQSVKENIELLRKETTFTVTTAHQPNIFTGPLYFIYKILHAVKLAAYCKQQFPEFDFVPVYYMGSEDADLEELGQLSVNCEKLVWNTKQAGAVGRMKVDKPLLALIAAIEAQVNVLPFGLEITQAIKDFYKEGTSIQEATLHFVNFLFAAYGLVVLIADNKDLKATAADIFRDELLHSRSIELVEATAKELGEAGYKVQAHGRPINLFYLTDEGRNRIERTGEHWSVVDTKQVFTREQIMNEVDTNPGRFSPNVILRPVFQERILPNLLFIGGGGELAYWTQLKKVFGQYNVPYPVLVLRNSFLFMDRQQARLKENLDISILQLFQSSFKLKGKWIHNNSEKDLDIKKAMEAFSAIYDELRMQAAPVDGTLLQHIGALETGTIKRVEALGKKMLRAEKRNHQDAMQQIDKLKDQLFPGNGLQERIENFIPFYARYGNDFIETLYQHSLALEQEFVVLEQE
ncbi:MAG: bacillithiol biosynthesis cysteine-adding enzyme BshC [Niabella sp.]|nr:bacillithiol biosynthesis cysteine-adding enzyme BshC [Niabella sp.]